MTGAVRPASDRACGVLLHPSSLPSEFGVGDLGPDAHAWLEWLAEARCSLWQVLPLGPTGYGDSPYQSLSAMAGNPLLISPELLAQQGLLQPGDWEGHTPLPSDRVDYAAANQLKQMLLQAAGQRFLAGASRQLRAKYSDFLDGNRDWLEDLALYLALKQAHGGVAWIDWPDALRRRDPQGLRQARRQHRERIELQRVMQFLFFEQWQRLRRRASELGIRVLGDVPIFVAHDSADLWAHPELCWLDERGRPTVVGGVPPDYFSETGQLWGNPLYRWETHQANDFAWWTRRMSMALRLVDAVRLDHFRGFEAYWEIPAEAETAETGRWVPAPGEQLLGSLRRQLGSLPLVAEDLGVITEPVEALRDRFGLPGMVVLQFAFTGEDDNEHLPENYRRRVVGYTGTHDNDTSVGWYHSIPQEERRYFLSYLATGLQDSAGSSLANSQDPAWELIEMLWRSKANWAIAPMQDFLSLGSEARMNFPGRPEGNWTWRVLPEQLSDELAGRIRRLNQDCGRAARH